MSSSTADRVPSHIADHVKRRMGAMRDGGSGAAGAAGIKPVR
jgi:hypothetical protein